MAVIQGLNFGWASDLVLMVLVVLLYVFIIIVFVAILGVMWYFLVYRKRLFNVDCILFVKRHGSPIIGYDKGGFVTKKKMSRFRLKKRKNARVAPPKYENLLMSEVVRNTLFLYKYGEQDYVPLKVQLDKEKILKLIPIEGLSKDSMVQDIREIIQDLEKQGFLEKWGPPILMIIAVIIIVAGMYMTTGLLVRNMAQLSGVLQDLGTQAIAANAVGSGTITP